MDPPSHNGVAFAGTMGAGLSRHFYSGEHPVGIMGAAVGAPRLSYSEQNLSAGHCGGIVGICPVQENGDCRSSLSLKSAVWLSVNSGGPNTSLSGREEGYIDASFFLRKIELCCQ